MGFIRRLFRPTNMRVRMAVGLLLLTLFCIHCAPVSNSRSTLVAASSGQGAPVAELKKLEVMAEKDPVALLDLGLEHYQQTVQNYTCTFIKQERIKGELRPEQWIEVKYMEKPLSIAMKWVQNAPIGDAILYVDGKFNNQMVVRPKGIWNKLIGPQLRDPEGPEAMENTLRPVTMFGFRKMLVSLRDVYVLAEKRGDCTSHYVGLKNVAGRDALAIERILPLKDDYPAKKTIWYMDVKDLVPLGIEAYDWDDQLTCSYTYKDIKFNTSITQEDFTPAANGMVFKTKPE